MKLFCILLFGVVAVVCPAFADAMVPQRQLEYDLSATSSEEETWGAHADIMREESKAFGRTLGMSFHPDTSDTQKSRMTKLSGSSKRDTKGSGSRRKQKSGDADENSADEEKRTKSVHDTQANSRKGSLFHGESRSTQPSKASSDVESVKKSKKKKRSGGSRKLIRGVDVGQRKRMGSSSIRSNAQKYSERKQRVSFWPPKWLSL